MFTVLHRSPPLGAPLQGGGDAWAVATCQRQFVAGFGLTAECDGIDRFEGAPAYALLLEIATGLRSAVVGETNVAGQLRRAWQARETAQPQHPAPDRLRPLVRQLFIDQALVRQQWLTGVGGQSYGTLTRKLMAPARRERILVVGQGQLARSIVPALSGRSLSLYTRSPHAADWHPWARRYGRGKEMAALAEAESIVFCTPVDPRFDEAWAPGLATHAGRVLHLGASGTVRPAWMAQRPAWSLDDVLALAQTQRAIRSQRIEAARVACAQLAARLFDVDTAQAVTARLG